mmetsp:Transcript_69047/g.207112  ORF Transcript_69047/g.207112 Transcript_69047/m.207112 type:complete len:337 (-) Transcript_69047:1504-2514(-)
MRFTAHPQVVHRRRCARPVREDANARSYCGGGVQQERGQVDVRRRRVHRTNARRQLQRRADESIKPHTNLGLVDRPCPVRCSQRPLERMTHKLRAAAKMEDEVVVCIHKRVSFSLLQLTLARSEARKVHLLRPRAIHYRRHGRPAHRLVKVPLVHHVRHTLSLQCERSVHPHQHRHRCRAIHERILHRRVRDVCAHSNCPPTVPKPALHPVGARKQRRRPAVARVVVVDALHVVVARCLKQPHQVAFDALAAVQQRLRRHLQHADISVSDAVPLHQSPHRRQSHRHHVLVLVARRPLSHHQPHRVLALHVVCGLQVRCRSAVAGHVHLQRVDAGLV